jgi:hypothetical protein
VGARVERLVWNDFALDSVDLGGVALKLTLGLGSGLSRRAGDAPGVVYALTDRGPNLFVSQAVDDYGQAHLAYLRGVAGAKIMPMPWAGPEIVALRVAGGGVDVVRRIPLVTRSGARLTGVALPGSETEPIFDIAGKAIAADRLGADSEALAVLPNGSFLVAEEYGPSILVVGADGVVSERWVAAGREAELSHPDLPARGVLPERCGRRRPNRGFEALCASPDGRWLYLGFQSALMGEPETGVPVWKLDARTGALVDEWAYPFDTPASFTRDAARRKVGLGDLKICEFAWVGEDALIVLERIAHSTKVYRVELGQLPEKVLLFSSDNHPEVGSDMEGMAMLSPSEILLVSDNDFGVEGAGTEFWRISLEAPFVR